MEILKLSKIVAYDTVSPSDIQKLRIIEISEYKGAFNEQIIYMDGEVCFRRVLTKYDFENWETSEKLLFQRKKEKKCE